jgi:Cu(I)/Ag(I) efflux system protein CusF
MKQILLAILMMSCGWAAAVYGQNADMAEGQITKIDKAAMKVTIRHGEIKNLNMPPMRMVFQVRDSTLLEKIKPDQKVKFIAIEEKGAYIVTAIEPQSP